MKWHGKETTSGKKEHFRKTKMRSVNETPRNMSDMSKASQVNEYRYYRKCQQYMKGINHKRNNPFDRCIARKWQGSGTKVHRNLKTRADERKSMACLKSAHDIKKNSASKSKHQHLCVRLGYRNNFSHRVSFIVFYETRSKNNAKFMHW